jgi:hypothetical protein
VVAVVVALADLLVAVEVRVEARVARVQPSAVLEVASVVRVAVVLVEQIFQAPEVVVVALEVAAADITALAGKHL